MSDSLDAEGPATSARLSRWTRLLVAVGYAVVASAIAVDLATGPGGTLSPVLAAVPVLAGVGTRRAWLPLLAGAITLAGVLVLSFANSRVGVAVHVTAALTVAVVTLISAANVSLVAARERELAGVRTVAQAAQRALLRPVPERAGDLRIAVRYLAAAAEAQIGGDLYDVMPTAEGVRVLLGDVRGKGLAAVETAVDTLGVFREAALVEPDLPQVAARLDAALARRPKGEEFVTAVLVDLPDGGRPAVVVNCGHPPPLLRTATGVTEVTPPANAPPLALRSLVGDDYLSRTLAMAPGDLLLLYTDGVSEARDASGRFYPLAERLAALDEREPRAVLDRLVADVRAYVSGDMADDAALLAVRRV